MRNLSDENNCLFKKFVCVLLSISLSFCLILNVSAKSMEVPESILREKYGDEYAQQIIDSKVTLTPGLSYSECSDLEKGLRRIKAFEVNQNKIDRMFLDIFDIIQPNSGGSWEEVFNDWTSYSKIQDWCIQKGYDPDKFLLEQMDFSSDILDDVEKLTEPLPEGSEITVGPELLNYFQHCIDEANSSSDKIVTYTFTPSSLLDPNADPSWSDYSRYCMPKVTQIYLQELLNEHDFLWTQYLWGNYYVHYLEGDLSEYVFFAREIRNMPGGKGVIIEVRRVDGEPVVYYRQVMPQPPYVDGFQKMTSTPPDRIEFPPSSMPCIIANYDRSSTAIYQIYAGMQGAFTSSGRFTIYSDYGAALAGALYNKGTIPEIIQKSGSNVVHDNSVTYKVDNSQHNTYNYEYFKDKIGDTTGMTDDEVQAKIDEIFDSLEHAVESGNDIDERGFDTLGSLISNDLIELLNRILYEIRAIGDAVKDIKKSDSGGGLLNTLANLATGISSVIDLLKDFFVEDVGSAVGEVGEIASEVADVPFLAGISGKLSTIIGQLGILVGEEVAEDVSEAVGDGIDFGTTIGEQLTKKFPFSIPWDIQLIIDCLSATPETPKFEIPLVIPSWNIDTSFTIDLSDFQLLSDVAKWFFDILYILAITKLSLKILEVEIVHS